MFKHILYMKFYYFIDMEKVRSLIIKHGLTNGKATGDIM